MNDEIRDIINKSLPAQVGEVLKQRLIKADQDEQRLKDAATSIESLKAKITELTTSNTAALEILKREQTLVTNEAKLRDALADYNTKNAVLNAEMKLVNVALERDERILGLVFGNNRFKYSQHVQEQVAFPPPPASQYNSCPCPQSAQQSRSVQIEGEGQVPVVPK